MPPRVITPFTTPYGVNKTFLRAAMAVIIGHVGIHTTYSYVLQVIKHDTVSFII